MMDQSRTDWRLVWLLWAAGLGAAAQYGKISVIFDQLPRIYPDAGASLGFTVSLVGFIGILLGVIAGVLVARIGYRKAILFALVLGAVMSAIQASFPPLSIFLATRIIEGIAHLLIVVAAPTMIAQITLPQHRGFTLTLWGTFFGVAFAVLAWFGLPLAAVWGLGALIAAHAVYMGVMAIVLWKLLPIGITVPHHKPSLFDLLRAHKKIFSSANIGAPALGWLFYTICFVSILTVLPPFLPPELRALLVGAMPLMSILSSLTLGVFLLRFFSGTSVIMFGFILCAFCTLGLGVLPGNIFFALALGGSLGLVQGASFAAVPQLNKPSDHQALANGGLAQMGNLGNTSGTPIMVMILAGFGYTGMIAALFVIFLAGALVHYLLYLVRRAK